MSYLGLINLQAWFDRRQSEILPAGSLRARFVLGTFWALVGTLISQGLQLAATVLVARWLGKAEYGQLGIVRSTVGVFGVFVGLGLGLTATKYVSEFRALDPVRSGRIIGLSLTTALVSGACVTLTLVLVAPWLAAHTLASPAVAGPLALGSGLLFFGEINGVQIGALSGLEAFGAIARVNLWAGLCAFPAIISLTWIWGLKGAILGLVASQAINSLFAHVALRRETAKAGISVVWRGCWQERRVLWHFSLPAFLANALPVPATWACNTLLVNSRGGYPEMGLFSAADQWRTVVLFFPNILSRVLLPILSSGSREETHQDSPFTKTLEAGFSVALLVALPLAATLCFGRELVLFVYGKDFAAMGPPLTGLLCAAGIIALGAPSGLAVQAKGAMWLGFFANLIWAAMLLGCFHFFIGLGAWGLAISYTASYMGLACGVLWYICRLGYYPWGLWRRTVLACLVLVPLTLGALELPLRLSLWLAPAALAAALITAWALLPPGTVRVLRRHATTRPAPVVS